MNYYEEDYFPPFSDTPPLAFVEGIADIISAERNKLLSRLEELEKKRDGIVGRFMGESEAELNERRSISAKQYQQILNIRSAVMAEETARTRRESCFVKTGTIYAECIGFACGYSVYLDDNGELWAGDITDDIKEGAVRNNSTRLCPISSLMSHEAEAIVELAASEDSAEWCSRKKVERNFGL
jgi:hypothetical protein